MTRKRFLILAACLFPALGAQADNFYRWVDDDGKVHFTATLPPEYADRPYQVINEAGLVVEEVDPMAKPAQPEQKQELKRPAPLWSEEEKQLRSDRLLVLKYHSEEDLLDAMHVEIANLDYDARIIEQTQASVLKSLAAQIREAADRERAGMPVDPETDGKVRRLQQRLRSGVDSKAALQQREDSIRAMFTAELERYRYLMARDASPTE